MENLDSTTRYIEFYLDKLRHGEFEVAFHGLTEASHSVVPRLVNEFRREGSPSIRAELLAIIWNRRRPDAAAFLGEALNDPDPNVWHNPLPTPGNQTSP